MTESRQSRGKHNITRDEYTGRAEEYAPRGESLPQSKLTDDDVRLILASVEERERLKEEARQLSNKSLADKFGVHYRTIERLVQGHTWSHVV